MPIRTGKRPPPGYDQIEPVIEALENELRDKVKESNDGKRNHESIWPVHQINWQRSRYVYDMFYTYGRISRKVYEYCLKSKIADAALIAKWKKPGYERLCSTYVINPANFKFGTTSICRVPMRDRGETQKTAQDPTTGCLGCASGKEGGGARNIFGNKYGQNLAAVQEARAIRAEAIEAKRRGEETRVREQQQQQQRLEERRRDERERVRQESAAAAGESETDDECSSDEEDYGPAPAAGVWAGSQKLEAESQAMAGGEVADGDRGEDLRPTKKIRVTE
eukprot:CAMPEP_0198274600 /NCGR_PEP_ID=MMETSP1447-20131203/61062_1 /TAXON_ID=420782 /ORGANISM="Chaetoceros dichaeta, Strain CCMP1751" /LENGTH=278 /DNA_ID=CAMNT_0043968875 /DNA_START=84 /DNA_END=920 /DNA_ORIENTATION=+